MGSRLLLAALIAVTATGAKVNGPTSPTGAPIQLDFPVDRHQKNKAGRDGAGLCVFTSLGQAADWQHLDALRDMRDWMTKYPGGGYPSKVTEFIARKCKEAGVEVLRVCAGREQRPGRFSSFGLPATAGCRASPTAYRQRDATAAKASPTW